MGYVQENNDSFILTLPYSDLVDENKIRNVIRENNSPIKGLCFNEGRQSQAEVSALRTHG